MLDSRSLDDGLQIRRRRECVCGHRFTTYERIDLKFPRVIKRNDAREHFNRDKLHAGLEKSLEKRPISAEHIEGIIEKIALKISKSGEPEVSSQYLGELVMKALHEIDLVAYVRFASVYKQFQSTDDFERELNDISSGKRT